MQRDFCFDFSDRYEDSLRRIIWSVKNIQLDKFKEATRQLETDDDEERFNERLKRLAKQNPKDDAKDE